MLIKKPSASSFLKVVRGRATFAECICSHHSRPAADYTDLAWRYGAGWPTRFLRPLILCFVPRYFEAEDFSLERAADSHRREEIVEEMQCLRVSILRRGFWRYLGIGLNGNRLVRHYDNLMMRQGIAEDAKRDIRTNDSAIASEERPPS